MTSRLQITRICFHSITYFLLHIIINLIFFITDKDLPPETCRTLVSQLNSNFVRILTQFADYVDCIREYLTDHKKVEDVCFYLSQLPCSSKSKVTLFESSTRDKLLGATSFSVAFNILTDYTSFLNYHLFEKIIDKYIPIRDRQQQLEYPLYLRKYFNEHRVSEFSLLEPVLAKISDDKMTLIIILNAKSTCRVSEITDLTAYVAQLMTLDIAAVQIYNIEEGSVVVTLLIPNSIGMCIFTKRLEFTRQQENILSFTKIECNGNTYYPGKSL